MHKISHNATTEHQRTENEQELTRAAFNTGAIGAMHCRPLQRRAPVRVQ